MKTLIVLAVILAAGWYGFRAWRKSEAPAGPAYREVTVEKGSVRVEILATALVKPQNRLELNSPVAGRIDEFLVHEGDAVTNGQILGWVSSTDRATLLDAARARGGAEAERWKDLYRPAPLIAPLAGNVIARKREPGQSVDPSDAILVLSDRLIVEAAVDETDIRNIRVGQSVTVEFDAYRGTQVPARVDHLAFDADTTSGVTLYAVDVLCNETPAFLRSAMSANVKFLVAETNDVLILPVAALQPGAAGAEVLRRGVSPKAAPTAGAVTTGLDDGRMVEITSGLSEGVVVLIPDGLPTSTGSSAMKNPLVPTGRTGGRSRR